MQETLRKVEIFQELSEDQLRHLATFFVEVSVAAGAVVCRHRHSAQVFYVVKAGEVALREDVADKAAQTLARLGPGDYFGEFGIYDEPAGAVTAHALQESCILEISREDLLRFMKRHPQVALRLQAAASSRWVRHRLRGTKRAVHGTADRGTADRGTADRGTADRGPSRPPAAGCVGDLQLAAA